MSPIATPLRFEILPFASGEREAHDAPHPLTLTVTCSPRHGVDHSLDVACRLRAAGHTVILHVAARMVRGRSHLDELLGRMADAHIANVFLVGGDAAQPAGPYTSALDLLGELRGHPLAPRSIGVGAYPEGHPLIDESTLSRALREKDGVADSMTTQLCFDPAALLRWLRRMRDDGVRMPVYIGIPGAVDRGRLLEMSLRVGVGSSIRFLRKQRGFGRLLGRRMQAAEQLHAAVAPLVGDPTLGIAGLHYFTFNRLLETARWAESQAEEGEFTELAVPRLAGLSRSA